jgi:hypothetical protein
MNTDLKKFSAVLGVGLPCVALLFIVVWPRQSASQQAEPKYTPISATETNQANSHSAPIIPVAADPASFASSPITGAFGFTLGEKFEPGPDWSETKDGGYCYASPKYPPPFSFVLVAADASGRIYSIHADAATGLDSPEFFQSCGKVLSEKYAHLTPDDGKFVEFGDAARSVTLHWVKYDKGDWVEVTYIDNTLREAFGKAVALKKERSLRGKL